MATDTNQTPQQKDLERRQQEARDVVKTVQKANEELKTETMGPSNERAKQPGNPHPIAPEDRVQAPGPMQSRAADLASSHLQAAADAIQQQEQADQRLRSDPRYERDQKVYELGATGKLGLVPPSEAEVAAQAARAGLPPEVADKIPKSPEEQVADDMKRLGQAEERASAIQTGEQEGAPRNNLEANIAAGKKVGGAEGEAQAKAATAQTAANKSATESKTTIK